MILLVKELTDMLAHADVNHPGYANWAIGVHGTILRQLAVIAQIDHWLTTSRQP